MRNSGADPIQYPVREERARDDQEPRGQKPSAIWIGDQSRESCR